MGNERLAGVVLARISVGYALEGWHDPSLVGSRGSKEPDLAAASEWLRYRLAGYEVTEAAEALSLIAARPPGWEQRAIHLLGSVAWRWIDENPGNVWERDVRAVWPLTVVFSLAVQGITGWTAGGIRLLPVWRFRPW